LIAARKRGLIVKVLIDGIGSMNHAGELVRLFNAHDIIVKVYHPLPWDFDVYKSSVKKGSFLTKLFYFIVSINKRNHRKLCIIDKRIAWIGSYNITVIHLPIAAGGEGWKDHGLRITGDNVNLLAHESSLLWYRQKNRNLRKQLPHVLSSLNPIKRRLKAKRVTRAMHLAKHRIWIANAYFAPHPSIIAALKKASSRGVDVRILVGEKSDIVFFPVFSRSFFADLLKSGIKVYEWSESVLHCKILLIDNYAYSGSSNLNSRSHYHDLELDAYVCLPETIRDLETRFEEDFSTSQKIEASFLFENRFYIFTMSFIPRIIRYWL
jgi:cardiolipin synthase